MGMTSQQIEKVKDDLLTRGDEKTAQVIAELHLEVLAKRIAVQDALDSRDFWRRRYEEATNQRLPDSL